MISVKEKQQETYKALKDQFGYKNHMEAPRLEKIVINVGTGSMKDKDTLELVEDRIARITGQRPVRTLAKKSIASFGLREGNPVGYQVTLRGDRMMNFLEKLVHIALPRTKDFRGLSTRPIDNMGNYTLGIAEHTVFPETSDEELRNVFGMAITIVTTATNKDEAEVFFRQLGFPLKSSEKAGS